MIPITHWSYREMKDHFKWSLEKFIYFGGYPGAANLARFKDSSRWMNYINDSLIETTLSRDILLMTQVNKPALLRRLFQLGCCYSGQILTYTKLMGELQEAGNTTTLAHYLELLSGAGLLTGIPKYAAQKVQQKRSSPKFCVFNTALMSAQAGKSFAEAKGDPAYWGRLTESAVGAHLLNGVRGTGMQVFYWREGALEVDFVLQKGEEVIAIEVKSHSHSFNRTGLDAFCEDFKPRKVVVVGGDGTPLETFLATPVTEWWS